ncbi:hypothetical protein FIBSPDRAFT_861007 [Athelia psychrophila]|uniref:F-box domain-containing protein n=1 Tax=Athelia psychrophila TaxID=1759441 RepID=A0A166JQ52_9AGAM|nr:hypothetical protein FIBSPDRAFT_861007 [Fibularhizoctonia sp. CBS 109695]
MRRQELETLAFEHRALIAPIRSLPNELLSEVFEWSCALSPWDHDFPVSLALVCRHWRETAFATPAIWANITVGHYFQSDSSTKCGSAHQAKLWLERSANKSLVLKFPEPLDIYTELEIPEELISASVRWEFLHCSLNHQSSSLFRPIQGRLPILQSLILVTDETVYLTDLDLFETAPRLREVLLFTPAVDGTLKLPFNQLTKLSIMRFLPSHECLEYLRLCPNLTVFEAHIEMDQNATSVPKGPHLTHKCLRVLKLCGRLCYQSFLEWVTVPALQTLDIHDGTSIVAQGGRQVQDIFDMISRSACTITTLRCSITSPPASILDYMHLFPHLLNLDIALESTYASLLLRNLTSQGLSPKLETLDIYLDKPVQLWGHGLFGPMLPDPVVPASVDSQALITFLQARCAGTRCLQRVRITDDFCGPFEVICGHPEPPEIQALRDQGLSLLFGSQELINNHINRDTLVQAHTYES